MADVSEVPKSIEDLPESVRDEYKELLDKFVDHIDGDKLLDAGCGYGKDAEYFEEEHDLDVYGVDTDEERISFARQNKPGDFSVDDISDLEYEDNLFDGVWCNTVMQFFDPDEMREVVSELDRVLKSEGSFYSTFKLNDDSFEKDYVVREEDDRKRYLVSEKEVREMFPESYELDITKSSVNDMTVLNIYGEKSLD